MTQVVFDASAVIAAIKGERGAEIVFAHASDALVTTVNAAEIFTHAALKNLPKFVADAFLAFDGVSIVAFSETEAALAGGFVETTKQAGLSLGDRCCLAAAKMRDLPVLTADRPWAQFAQPLGIDIRVIR